MSSTASDPAGAQTIVLIHGMWMTPLSWEHWSNHYSDRGYHVLAPAWPALGNPANLKKEAPLTLEQFHWCFTNALSREESDAVYQRYYIPGSARPFFQAGFANFSPKAVTKVDYRNPTRPPLLLMTGTEDRICPPSVNKANFKKQRQAPTATEHREFPGRCHFPGQDGWEEVADFALSWTTEHSKSRVAPPA